MKWLRAFAARIDRDHGTSEAASQLARRSTFEIIGSTCNSHQKPFGGPMCLRDHELRFRTQTIEPGGVVPWHSHGDRPALIYVAEGEIHEFASNCAAPIVHKEGDLRRETSEVSHWWKNLGDTTVILLVADVLHDRTDHNM
jgi:quercetin dioxygenase-like cupin family protein